MINRLNTFCIPFTLSILAVSGLGIAQTTTGSAPEVRSTTETVSVQTTTLKDGENTVEVRVVDGQVFVKLNGEQQSTRSLDGDWMRFEVKSKDDKKTIATVLRDSKSRGVMVLSGSPTEEDLKQYRQITNDADEFDVTEWVTGLEGLAEFEVTIDENLDSLVEALARHDMSEEATADILREIERSLAGSRSPFGTFRFEPGEQPKSMIGILMSVESDDDQEVVVIEEVMEGMPAERAGLRAGDRIIEIESIGRADEQAVRRLTREREPGERVVLRILRGDEQLEKVIELAPYEGRVSGLTYESEGAPGQRFFSFERDAAMIAETQSATDRLREEIAKHRAEIERLTERLTEGAEPGPIADQLREASRRLVENERRLSEQRLREEVEMGLVQRLRAEDGGGVIVGRAQRGERPLMLTFPQPPSAPPAPPRPGAETERAVPDPRTRERIESLESRLDALETSNQRIEEMLQTLMEQLAQRG